MTETIEVSMDTSTCNVEESVCVVVPSQVKEATSKEASCNLEVIPSMYNTDKSSCREKTPPHNLEQSSCMPYKEAIYNNTEDSSCREEASHNFEQCTQYKEHMYNTDDSASHEEPSLCKVEITSCKQEASSCHLDAEMMIALIKQHPIIWDTKSKEYNTTAKRLNAWRYVSSQLGIDENICRSKWKNIRDSYKKCINRREMAIRSGARRKKPPFCRYFKELEFLHDIVSLKDSVDNITSTSNNSSFIDDDKPTQTKTYIVCTDAGDEFVNHPIPIDLETRTITDDDKLKRSDSLPEMEQKPNQVREYTKYERSESELFCDSLIGTLDRLDHRNRQLAKIKIQQVLFELEFSDPENNYAS